MIIPQSLERDLDTKVTYFTSTDSVLGRKGLTEPQTGPLVCNCSFLYTGVLPDTEDGGRVHRMIPYLKHKIKLSVVRGSPEPEIRHPLIFRLGQVTRVRTFLGHYWVRSPSRPDCSGNTLSTVNWDCNLLLTSPWLSHFFSPVRVVFYDFSLSPLLYVVVSSYYFLTPNDVRGYFSTPRL